jgi:twitching motility protein PilT
MSPGLNPPSGPPRRPGTSRYSDDHRIGQSHELSMQRLFEHAAHIGASDLLITTGSPPIVRVDGDLLPAAEGFLTAPQTKQLIWGLINETQQEMFERKRELDFSLAVTGDHRFRANIYFQRGTVAGAFRVIPKEIPKLESLGLPPVVQTLPSRTHGLILVTGPTGSGKSTTQATMIDVINRSRRCHIVTIEDPIEFVHENKMAVIDQREVYADTLTFSNALKYVLRQDPDVILVGEMRDVETISSALTAAETGHLVIATLHTNDAVQSIDRIVDAFPPHQQNQVRSQLAFVLEAVVSQQLVPRASGRGRVLACEILLNNHAVAAHIRDSKTHQSRGVIETSRGDGMITMDWHLKELFDAKLITYDELARRVSSPAFLERMASNAAPRTDRRR